jgi:hypothetical protein
LATKELATADKVCFTIDVLRGLGTCSDTRARALVLCV